MKSISSWNDLQQFGIIALTGESCGLGYRLLCDVTQRGSRIIARMLGLNELPLPENWNHGDDNDPHVGSIMLAPPMLVSVGIFALLESGCSEVWLFPNQTLVGIEETDDPTEVRLYRQSRPLVRTFAYRGTCGDRNMHVMSGRVS